MKTQENHVRRIRISEKQLEAYRAYFCDISFQKFVDMAIDNEIRRKQKKRLRLLF
jgi:post-segregation antitoxin (ccd killing protein)